MTLQRDLAWKELELKYRSSVSHHFARYALGLNYAMLPDAVTHQAKRCLLDALGCAIGAYDAPGRKVCEAAVGEIGGPGESTLFCSGKRASALNATLVNTFLVRFLDCNDSGGGGHNGDAIASILAVAEREHASGKDFLTSLVVSYELGARFRESINNKGLEERGWTADIRAGLNQPPALGRLMGLNQEQIANAIGVCMSHTLPLGILDSNQEENTMAKNLRFGWAAHDAILACILARNGFTGPVRVVESDAGIRRIILQDEMDMERLLDFSGWRILKVKFKALPAVGSLHGQIFAALAIQDEHHVNPRDIAEIHITGSVQSNRHTTAPPKKYPRNAESADHSAFYAVAYAIARRSFDIGSTDPVAFTDPVILELIEKTSIETDTSMSRSQGQVEIITTDGRVLKKRVDNPKGLGSGMTDADLENKFRSMAREHLTEQRIQELVDLVWHAEDLDDVGKLMRLMVVPKR